MEEIPAALGLLCWFFQGMTFWALVLLVIVLAALVAAARKDQKREEQAADDIWARWPDKGAALVFYISPEDFRYQTPVSAFRYHYSVLRDLLEDDAYYFLFISEAWAYVLKKANCKWKDKVYQFSPLNGSRRPPSDTMR